MDVQKDPLSQIYVDTAVQTLNSPDLLIRPNEPVEMTERGAWVMAKVFVPVHWVSGPATLLPREIWETTRDPKIVARHADTPGKYAMTVDLEGDEILFGDDVDELRKLVFPGL